MCCDCYNLGYYVDDFCEVVICECEKDTEE